MIEEPDDLVSSYGQTLGSIVLPEGWTWEDPDLVLNETIPWFGIGYNSFAARFDVSQYEINMILRMYRDIRKNSIAS